MYHAFTINGRLAMAGEKVSLILDDAAFTAVAEKFNGTFPKGVHAHHFESLTASAEKRDALRKIYNDNGGVYLNGAFMARFSQVEPAKYAIQLIESETNL